MSALSPLLPGPGDALLIVDVQRDFLPGGSLAVPFGDQVIEPMNAWIGRLAAQSLPVFASRDWHPPDHCSFQPQGGVWPPHCVADTPGAAFDPRLELPANVHVVTKADTSEIDAYSAFAGTSLHAQLQALGVRRLFVGGVATDYCVLNSVLDARRLGYEVVLLLIDTYDTEAAARAIAPLVHQLAREGIVIQAVRLDSGDLGEHARRVREILDAGGLPDIAIFASGNLDEYAVGALVAAGAPISGFGVGTRMNTSADHPYLDCAYKMQEYRGVARRKHSEGKTTWPGRKQVFRRFDAAGLLAGDALTLQGDTQPGRPLLEPVMAAGRRLAPAPSLAEIREWLVAQLAGLSPAQRALPPPRRIPSRCAPPCTISPGRWTSGGSTRGAILP